MQRYLCFPLHFDEKRNDMSFSKNVPSRLDAKLFLRMQLVTLSSIAKGCLAEKRNGLAKKILKISETSPIYVRLTFRERAGDK